MLSVYPQAISTGSKVSRYLDSSRSGMVHGPLFADDWPERRILVGLKTDSGHPGCVVGSQLLEMYAPATVDDPLHQTMAPA